MPMPNAVRWLSWDDPTSLTELVSDARVVALGENNHHIREFGLLRQRILRHLVTELGFGVLAFETGFAEGSLVDDWIRGGPGDVETVAGDGFTFRFGDAAEVRDMLCWTREHNASGGRVRFAGLDVPGSGGSNRSALLRVREYLAMRAPDDVALVDAAVTATEPYRAANNGVASTRYAAMSQEQRDTATAALSRLVLRMDSLVPDDPEQHRIARHHALGALRLDEQLREFDRLGAPDAGTMTSSSRDVYQAETVRLLRELFGPDERIVLMMHNGHVQRTPMRLVPNMHSPSVGCYLAAELGADYVVLGVTALTGTTTDLRIDEGARDGIRIVSVPLPPYGVDSVEQAVEDSGAADEPVLLDLRPARGTPGPTTIRHVTMDVPTDVLRAFDGLVCLPTMNPSSFVLGEGS